MHRGLGSGRRRSGAFGPPWFRALLGPWLLVWLLPPSLVAAQVRDLDLRWRTLHTPHFELHYHEPLGVLARHVAAAAERARVGLAPVLGDPLDERVQLVLTDGTDFSNGSALVVPRAEVRLFATAPEDLSFLEDYEDWFTVLVTHEQAHVMHLGRVGGLPRLFDALFGRWWTPNNAAPRWLVEGLATWQETARTGRGRLRSSLVDMALRADALEGRQPSLDELSGELDRWPRGHMAYLYGGHFVAFVASRCGEGFWRRYARMAGRQVVPYALNRYARRLCGRTFLQLYDGFLAEWRRRARALVARRRRTGLREGRRLTLHGETVRRPRFVGPGTLAYVVADGRSRPAIRLLAWPSGRPVGHDVRVAGAAGFAPVGRGPGAPWVVSRLEPLRDIYALHDLVEVAPRSGRTRRLTRGLRARQPDVSPDGRLVVFTRESAGSRHLVLAERADVEGTARLLLRSERFGQVDCPRFDPSGRRVAFSWRRPGRGRDVALYELDTGRLTLITDDVARDGCPTFDPSGRWLVFSSDRVDGVPDLYALRLGTRSLRRLTRVRTGAFHPEVSPDGRQVVYVGYTSRGYDLYALPFEPTRGEALELPAVAAPSLACSRRRDLAPLPLPSRPYEPLRSLGPRYWLLDYRSEGALGLGSELAVLTEGGDVVGFHAYRAAVRFALRRQPIEPSAELSWRVRRSQVPWSLWLYHRVEARGGLSVGGRRRRWLARAAGGELSADYAIPAAGTFGAHRLAGGLAVEYLAKVAPFGGRLDPNEPPPRLPTLGWGTGLRAAWSFADVTRQAWDVTSSEGYRLALSAAWREPLLGGRRRSLSLRWAATGYLRAPWHRLHVLAVRYGGGAGLAWDGGPPPRFGLGGFGERPLLDVVLGAPPLGGVALRGYEPWARSGAWFGLLQTEWRFPLARPMLGWRTLPLFLRRLWGTLFVDVGEAADGLPERDDWGLGIGAELHADVLLGYYLPLSLRAGLAWGALGEGGGTSFYVHVGQAF